MLDDDQYEEEQHLFDDEEEPVDGTDGKQGDLNERNSDEIIELLPTDRTARCAKHAPSGGHPAEHILPGKSFLSSLSHADLPEVSPCVVVDPIEERSTEETSHRHHDRKRE